MIQEAGSWGALQSGVTSGWIFGFRCWGSTLMAFGSFRAIAPASTSLFRQCAARAGSDVPASARRYLFLCSRWPSQKLRVIQGLRLYVVSGNATKLLLDVAMLQGT